jgi:hypothetical protein
VEGSGDMGVEGLGGTGAAAADTGKPGIKESPA